MGKWVDSWSCVWRMLKGEYQSEWTEVLKGLNKWRLDDGHHPIEISHLQVNKEIMPSSDKIFINARQDTCLNKTLYAA